MLLLLLAACPDDPGTSSSPAPCPDLDCRDALHLTAVRIDETAPVPVEGTATTAEGVTLSFDCTGDGDGVGYGCLSDGTVVLYLYSATVEVTVWDTEGWAGTATLTPAWEDPYASAECGSYCWEADASVEIDPGCDTGCG